MGKIRLTEGQFEMLQIITEAEEDFDWYIREMEKVNNSMNAIYNKLIFTTIAEIIDGDVDLGILNNKIDELDNIKNKLTNKVDAQRDKIPTDIWDREYKDFDMVLENPANSYTAKWNVMYDMMKRLEFFAKNSDTIKDRFSDIKRIEV